MELKTVDIDKITSNPLQPREKIDRGKLAEMAKSIKEVGIVQPIIVRPKGKMYEIISGERRWQASKIAKVKKIPVIIKELDDNKVAVESLIENIHREDLNDVEKAKSLKRIMEAEKIETVSKLATIVGMSETAIHDIFDSADMREDLEKVLGPGISEKVSQSVITETKGLEKEERIKIIEKAAKDDMGGRKVREVVTTMKKAPEPIRKAIIEEKLDVEDVKPLVEHGIPEDMVEPTVEELTIRKKKKEEMRKLEVETDLAMMDGDIKATEIKIDRSADEKRLAKYQEISDVVRWWTVNSVDMIKSKKSRDEAIQCIKEIEEHCRILLQKLGEIDVVDEEK